MKAKLIRLNDITQMLKSVVGFTLATARIRSMMDSLFSPGSVDRWPSRRDKSKGMRHVMESQRRSM